MFDIININKIPTIDLHGETRDIARIRINEFINDNIKLKEEYIAIIHGKGEGILKRETWDTLKNSKYVLEYKSYYYNDGMTIVKLKREDI